MQRIEWTDQEYKSFVEAAVDERVAAPDATYLEVLRRAVDRFPEDRRRSLACVGTITRAVHLRVKDRLMEMVTTPTEVVREVIKEVEKEVVKETTKVVQISPKPDIFVKHVPTEVLLNELKRRVGAYAVEPYKPPVFADKSVAADKSAATTADVLGQSVHHDVLIAKPCGKHPRTPTINGICRDCEDEMDEAVMCTISDPIKQAVTTPADHDIDSAVLGKSAPAWRKPPITRRIAVVGYRSDAVQTISEHLQIPEWAQVRFIKEKNWRKSIGGGFDAIVCEHHHQRKTKLANAGTKCVSANGASSAAEAITQLIND